MSKTLNLLITVFSAKMIWFPTLVAILLMRSFSQGIAANLARDPRSLRVKRDVEDEGGEEYKGCVKK